MSPRRARLRYYAPSVVAAAAAGVNVTVAVIAGDLWHTATAAALVVVLAFWSIRRRAAYREGWTRGFLEGETAPYELWRGGIPHAVMREAATGDPRPEPWEVKTYWN